VRGWDVDRQELLGSIHRSAALDGQIGAGREIDQEAESWKVEVWKRQRMSMKQENIKGNLQLSPYPVNLA